MKKLTYCSLDSNLLNKWLAGFSLLLVYFDFRCIAYILCFFSVYQILLHMYYSALKKSEKILVLLYVASVLVFVVPALWVNVFLLHFLFFALLQEAMTYCLAFLLDEEYSDMVSSCCSHLIGGFVGYMILDCLVYSQYCDEYAACFYSFSSVLFSKIAVFLFPYLQNYLRIEFQNDIESPINRNLNVVHWIVGWFVYILVYYVFYIVSL